LVIDLRQEQGSGMSHEFLATLALAAGLIAVAPRSASMTAGQSDGAPAATGSMDNGNSAQPPNLGDDTRVAAGANQAGSQSHTPAGDDSGRKFGALHAGGGG
jgi:hypothetical protein